MIQSQSCNFATMAQDMVVNNEDQKALIKANIYMEVNIKTKRQMKKISNFLKSKKLGVLTYAKFKIKIGMC